MPARTTLKWLFMRCDSSCAPVGPVTSLRWSQAGFNEAAASRGTPRNLLGFKDGTSNPRTSAELAAVRLGGVRCARVDGGWDLPRHAAHQNFSRALGRPDAANPGAGHRPPQGDGRSPRADQTNSTRSISGPRIRQVARSSRSTPMFGWRRRRRTGAQPCSAAAIRTATARRRPKNPVRDHRRSMPAFCSRRIRMIPALRSFPFSALAEKDALSNSAPVPGAPLPPSRRHRRQKGGGSDRICSARSLARFYLAVVATGRPLSAGSIEGPRARQSTPDSARRAGVAAGASRRRVATRSLARRRRSQAAGSGRPRANIMAA